MKNYRYLIVGGGISADAACRSIRSLDADGTIGLITAETYPPYNRPPLSKGLWKGQPVDQIWRGTELLQVDLHPGRKVLHLDSTLHQVSDQHGDVYSYTKILLATGGSPIHFPEDSENRVIYFHNLDDYYRLRQLVQRFDNFVVVGGGFIGSELASVLVEQGKKVTLLFLEDGIGGRLFPSQLSAHLNDAFILRGVRVIPRCKVHQIKTVSNKILLKTDQGVEILGDAVVAGLGIRPNLDLALQAGLQTANGIVVDQYMRTSNPDIFACGDAVSFPSTLFGHSVRVEHEEHANQSGQVAGANMTGGRTIYDPIPSFYSSFFDYSYDAVGDIDPKAEVVMDWIEPFRQGTIYYLRNERVRGVLLWNIPGRQEKARELIGANERVNAQELVGRIQPMTLSPSKRMIRIIRKEPPQVE
jgi:3-phenylpropionate/trans-cinnamate dioxygenase ferredoxin reductase component